MMIGEPNHHSHHTYISNGLDNTTMVDQHNHHHIASSPPSLGTHHRHLINPTATSFQLSSSPPSPLSINSTLNGGDSSPPHVAVNPYHLTDYDAILSALSRYLPSNSNSNSNSNAADLIAAETHQDLEGACPYTSAKYDSDEFRMYDFKVRGCTRAKAHDWTECPFAHPGEKARRRDPRLYGYTGTACTDFRKGNCRRGDSCEFAHGVFECWLHPTRYRTQACKDGPNCTRRVCFFAHSPDELRVLSPRSIVSMGSGSDPFDEAAAGGLLVDSPPVTPLGRSFGSGSVNELLTRMRNLQLDKVKSMPAASNKLPASGGSSWNHPLGSPPSAGIRAGGFYSLPTTPTTRIGFRDVWAEEVPERVLDSGRELRAKMFERLSKDNPLADRIDSVNCGSGPDVGWVSDLLK